MFLHFENRVLYEQRSENTSLLLPIRKEKQSPKGCGTQHLIFPVFMRATHKCKSLKSKNFFTIQTQGCKQVSYTIYVMCDLAEKCFEFSCQLIPCKKPDVQLLLKKTEEEATLSPFPQGNLQPSAEVSGSIPLVGGRVQGTACFPILLSPTSTHHFPDLAGLPLSPP